MPKRLTLESFIEKANLKHNYKYDYSQVEYKNSSTRVKILCVIHGQFEQIANCHLQGQGCKKCGDIQKGITYSKSPIGESVADKYPSLIVEWSNKNKFGPNHYRYGSKKKVWWQCQKCNHEWEQVPVNRTVGKTGCPACRFSSKIVTTKNRLSDKYPEIAKEWDYNKNYPLKPSEVSFGIRKKIWWICPECQHSYQSLINSRTTNKTACPKCRESQGEKEVRKILIAKNIKFKSQFRISKCRNLLPLPFDFALWVDDKFALIEYNGIQHYKSDSRRFSPDTVLNIKKRDKIKQEYCKRNNIPLLVIKYTEQNLESIIDDFIKEITYSCRM